MPDEKVINYGLRVKNIARKAEITDEKIIIHRFITGLKYKSLKIEMMKSKSVKFDEIIQEAANTDAIYKSAQAESENINQVKPFKDNNKNNQKYKNNKNNKNNKKDEKKKVKKNQCFFCKKGGHWKKNCIKYKKWLEKKNDDKKVDNVCDDLGSLNIFQ